MTHQHHENNELWYPQLPGGYDENQLTNQPTYYAHGFDHNVWMQNVNPMPTGTPGYGMPGYGMPGYGQMPFLPGQQLPGGSFNQWPTGPNMPGHWDPPSQQQPHAPTTPPPQMTPSYPTHQAFAVDPGAIRGCLYRMTYIWLSRRQGFWFYPVFVGRTSVAGYRWHQRQRRWSYTGFDLDRINQFTCF